MIKGSPQAFRFTTPYNFDDIMNIVAVFNQTGNTTTGMPITKRYNKSVTKLDAEWNPTGKDTSKVYYASTKYYRYNSSAWVSSDTLPTEAQISGGAVSTYPLSGTCEESKVYKCDKSYYQYDPAGNNWVITATKPVTTPTELTTPGVSTISDTVDKKKACVYKQQYYQYNGTEWEPSSVIKPIIEIDYWDIDKVNTQTDGKYYYSRNGETYCARETYYKYIDNAWHSYGCECMEPVETFVWNNTFRGSADKSKIYVFREFFYEYDEPSDKFVKTAKKEVYYKYSGTAWVECNKQNNFGIDVVGIGLWDSTGLDTSKVYVCKNVYYNYDATKTNWSSTNLLQYSVIEIDKFDSTKTYDTSKIYLCPTRYYQYNIAKSTWEEVEEIKEPKAENLPYWTEPGNRDKTKVYLCGPTYYQYDSSNSKWQPSATLKIQVVDINDLSKRTDESKIYRCCPLYYIYKDNAWKTCTNPAEVAKHNENFGPVAGNPKAFEVLLTAEETNLFSTQYKGHVQVQVHGSSNTEIKSKIEYFTVYPSSTDEIFTYTPSATTETLLIFDAGKII